MDWEYFIVSAIFGLISSIISFISGMYVFNKYFLPKLTAKMFVDGFKHLQADPEISIYMKKGKEIINRLEPVMKQLKNVDLNKIQKELRPFFEAAKKIDPKDVEDLMKSLKNLTGTVQQAIEKPKIPKPKN